MTDCLHERLLLDRVSKNDREAFKIIYTQYLNDTYRYLFLFTKSREACEEIVQSVFMKIWERRAHLAQITNFRSYIYRSAKNMLIDEIRRKKVGERAFAALRSESQDSGEMTDGRLIYHEYEKLTQKAIDFLPAKRKQIFELHTRDEYSFDEIANILSISKSVVKKQLYAGMLFVKTYIRKHGELDI